MPIIAGRNFVQEVYRFYNDDGSESANTAAAAQDTALGLTLLSSGDGKVALRIAIAETAGGTSGNATDDFALQYDTNASGTWTTITTGTSKVKAFNSSNLTEGGATTQRLTGASGTFSAGKCSEDGTVDDLQIAASFNSEMLWAIQVDYANVSNADALTFRVLCNGAVIEAYSVTPTINITKPTALRNANTLVEVLSEGPAPTLRISNSLVEVLSEGPAPSLRNANTLVEVLSEGPTPTLRVGDVFVQVLASVDNVTRPTRRASAGLSAY